MNIGRMKGDVIYLWKNIFEKSGMEKKMKICPNCGEEYFEPPAISRTDNKTEICSSCGIREAVKGLIPESDVEELIQKNKELYRMNGF